MAFGHIKKGQMHRDLGKAPGAAITDADISKERAKGGVFAKRANFAEESREGKFKPGGKKKRSDAATASKLYGAKK